VISGSAVSASSTVVPVLAVELGTVVADAAVEDPNFQSSITRARRAIVKVIHIIRRTGSTKMLSTTGIECKKRAL
jgi:isopentenyl diphosphate isomerase/L-lactate dehydrogenase-like FMN-dependent dehydrogenase